jgi:hypothetical protein
VQAKGGRSPYPSEDDPRAVGCEGKLEDGSECGKPIWEDETKCPHCGALYTADGKLIPKEEPRKLRKRGEAAPAAKAAEMEDLSAPVAPKKAAVPTKQREPGDDTEEDEDELPF